MNYTVRDIAALRRRSVRTAHRDVEVWAGCQDNPRVPRVTRQKPGPGTRGGRPAYRIDAASFERWRRTGDASLPSQAQAA